MNTSGKRKKPKPIKAWGGFINGKLSWFIADAGFAWAERVPSIYKTRAEAKKRFRDFRRVTITVTP